MMTRRCPSALPSFEREEQNFFNAAPSALTEVCDRMETLSCLPLADRLPEMWPRALVGRVQSTWRATATCAAAGACHSEERFRAHKGT